MIFEQVKSFGDCSGQRNRDFFRSVLYGVYNMHPTDTQLIDIACPNTRGDCFYWPHLLCLDESLNRFNLDSPHILNLKAL
jgi:hypothetical protein